MRDHFEVRSWDAAARLGDLEVPRAGVTVRTPALMPVVNPNLETIAPERLGEEFGAEILITNSYIVRTTDGLRERAREQGLHDLLGFDGAIVTDSGSFQLAEYGEISVTTEEIVEFQREIGSDVATPVDVPTPPDASREQATADLETTRQALDDAAAVDTGEMLVNAPVQGSTHLDLREQSGRAAAATDHDVFPVGAAVPLLNDYRYADLVEVILAAKRGLGTDCPVHLFGAGHPMMLALATAAGCDLFDSAAYALYARDDRYLTVAGTRELDGIEAFPCSCAVCTDHTPADLRDRDGETRERLLAEHNLHVTFAEMRRIRDAIRRGRLLELVERRARGHPGLLDGYRTLLDHVEQVEQTEPASGDSFFHVSAESARRPAVVRHHERLSELSAPDRLLCSEYDEPKEHDYDAVWRVVPPFGPFPRALSSTYPVTATVPERTDRAAARAAAEGVAALASANPETRLTLAHDDWAETALAALPDGVETENLAGIGEE
ncbi:tRNA guanosine(15) transglycosylase TgtA [Halobaculum sp. MBLA0143]|uniref:tRNA guanosine(15) transglycosylase TgtA n=1 Tax=Halobaculum sp. MBLA0143 TaxID=3079933 RepID=UPI0035250C78